VLETLATVEAQVEDDGERFYQMRVQPYRTVENVIEGAVLTFADVTEQQQLQSRLDEAARAVAEAGEFAQSVLDTVREPQLVLDGELTVVTANEAFLATFELAPDAVLGRHLREVYGGEWLRPDLLELLMKVLPTKRKLDDYVLSLTGGALGPCKVTLNALELLQTPEKRRLMLLTVTDIDRGA
jgi:two-component system, chemotaxis family, CheB/CheR fusion protein